MTRKDKWKLLLDALDLKVGDKIVRTFSNLYLQKKTDTFVVTKKSKVYELCEEENRYYFIHHTTWTNPKTNEQEPFDDELSVMIILDDFVKYNENIFKETEKLTFTRDEFYKYKNEQQKIGTVMRY